VPERSPSRNLAPVLPVAANQAWALDLVHDTDGWARLSRSVISLPEASVVMDGDVIAGNGLQQPDAPRGLPFVSSLPGLPLMIPDEILDYYGWVFCQGGFLNLQMTFEQFLIVVAAVSPTAVCPEYDESDPVRSSD
jgi:hypothetical protein